MTSNGELEIRVNRLQITGTLGNENLLKHTSPRKTVLVPHWNETANEVTTAYEDVDSDGNSIVV